MFCPECGAKNKDGASFCGSCGFRVGGNQETGSNNRESSAGIAGEMQQGLDHGAAVQRTTSKKSQTNLLVVAIIASLVVAAAAGAGVYLGFIRGGDSGVSAASKKADSANDDSGRQSGETNNSPAGTSTVGTESSGDFAAFLDAQVARNSQLEQLIVSTANEINRVAPSGITSAMLNSVTDLETQFSDIKTQVSMQRPPASFSKSNADFLKLVEYNITRSHSLYEGSVAWRSNNSNYLAYFDTGRVAKESYYALLPVFQQEYANAKTGI